MTLIASDGYEYADLAQRILGRPLENARNQQVASLRFRRRPEGQVRAWCAGYDGCVEDPYEGKRWAAASIASALWASQHSPG